MDRHRGVPGGKFADQQWTLSPGVAIRPVERTDIEALRVWRNEQQGVLRQQQPLTSAHQKQWFEARVQPAQLATHPPEILVAVTEDDVAVSYGGLTNIDWTSHRAELSFLAATERASNPAAYASEFTRFLTWVKHYTFSELGLHRLFTETWASRSEHIRLLEAAGFVLEGTMRDHVVKDGVPVDALIHGLVGPPGDH